MQVDTFSIENDRIYFSNQNLSMDTLSIKVDLISFHFRIKIENLRKFLNRRKMQRIGKALVAISAFKEAARCG